jgi:hypothetical protein
MTLGIATLSMLSFISCSSECHYPECLFAECHYSECLYVECIYVECYSNAECRYAECHYAKRRYAKCCYVKKTSLFHCRINYECKKIYRTSMLCFKTPFFLQDLKPLCTFIQPRKIWVQSHKTFLGVNILTLFGKLDLFIDQRGKNIVVK